jgi:hypothetical protein
MNAVSYRSVAVQQAANCIYGRSDVETLYSWQITQTNCENVSMFATMIPLFISYKLSF